MCKCTSQRKKTAGGLILYSIYIPYVRAYASYLSSYSHSQAKEFEMAKFQPLSKQPVHVLITLHIQAGVQRLSNSSMLYAHLDVSLRRNTRFVYISCYFCNILYK